MAHHVLWIDSVSALIFHLTPGGIEKTHLERKNVTHHTFNKKDHHGDTNTENFYRDLSSQLSNAEEILIIGPGLAKNHFKTYLETHHKNDLARRIVGVKNSDHPTDNQILAAAREFFRTYNLFNHPIQIRSHQ